MRKVFFAFCLCFLPVLTFATELPMTTAVLRGLDKVTGRIKTFEIPVGESGQFGRTFVVVESCFTHPPEESPENSAFLYVYEKSLKGENIELFKGWMFSSDPALSSMEHPVYDIWVLSCKGEKVPITPTEKDIQPEEVPVAEPVDVPSSESFAPTEAQVEDLN